MTDYNNGTNAVRVLVYLHARPADQFLPSAKQIAAETGLKDAGTVCDALDVLTSGKKIEHVHGTSQYARGHRVIRLLDGRVLATENCPLVLGAPRPVRPAKPLAVSAGYIPANGWTEDELATLRNEWPSGVSASQIGLKIPGRSRHAIVKKARDLHLGSRPSPIVAHAEPPAPKIAAAPRVTLAPLSDPLPLEPEPAGVSFIRRCQFPMWPHNSRPLIDRAHVPLDQRWKFCDAPSMLRHVGAETVAASYCPEHYRVCNTPSKFWTAHMADTGVKSVSMRNGLVGSGLAEDANDG